LIAKFGRWVAKVVAHLLATSALWVQIQTSLEWATYAKEWPTHFSQPKNIQKKNLPGTFDVNIAFTFSTCLTTIFNRFLEMQKAEYSLITASSPVLSGLITCSAGTEIKLAFSKGHKMFTASPDAYSGFDYSRV
jgi:hypothetical protein